MVDVIELEAVQVSSGLDMGESDQNLIAKKMSENFYLSLQDCIVPNHEVFMSTQPDNQMDYQAYVGKRAAETRAEAEVNVGPSTRSPALQPHFSQNDNR